MLFQIYSFAWALLRPASALLRNTFPKAITVSVSALESASANFRKIQCTEIRLKPETTKCYARQLERATENSLPILRVACCDANICEARTVLQIENFVARRRP